MAEFTKIIGCLAPDRQIVEDLRGQLLLFQHGAEQRLNVSRCRRAFRNGIIGAARNASQDLIELLQPDLTLSVEGIADGSVRPLDPAMVSAMLFGALNWVPHWYDPNGKLSVDQVADTFADMLAQGIEARPRAR